MVKRVFTQTFGVVGAIIEKEGKILLVKEGLDSHDPGNWNQLAGWIDVGEDPLVAIKREIKEETGYNFEPTGFLGVYSMQKNYHSKSELSRHAIKLLYCGKVSGQPIVANDEIAELKWFTPEEIYQMDAPPLRDADIKNAVKDYLIGKIYPLEIVRHSEMEVK